MALGKIRFKIIKYEVVTCQSNFKKLKKKIVERQDVALSKLILKKIWHSAKSDDRLLQLRADHLLPEWQLCRVPWHSTKPCFAECQASPTFAQCNILLSASIKSARQSLSHSENPVFQ